MENNEISRKENKGLIIVNEFFLRADLSGENFSIYRVNDESSFDFVGYIPSTQNNFISNDDIYDRLIELNLIHYMHNIQLCPLGTHGTYNATFIMQYFVREVKPSIKEFSYQLLCTSTNKQIGGDTFYKYDICEIDKDKQQNIINSVYLNLDKQWTHTDKILSHFRKLHKNCTIAITNKVLNNSKLSYFVDILVIQN